MPPRKGTRKRVQEPPSEAEAVEASDSQTPPPKKPRGLGRARSRSVTPPSVVMSEASIAKGKGAVYSQTEEEIEEMTEMGMQPEKLLNNVSYIVMEQMAGVGVPPRPKRHFPPRQQRWKHDGDEPITNIEDVPEGWNANEPDLDYDDVDAQIDRCFERLEDGIMPRVFEIRLDSLLAARNARNAMIDSEPTGLSYEIVQRLHALKLIKDHLETKGDPDVQLPNVRALLKAYRAGELKWSEGMVTYWSNGLQLNTPTKFNRELHEQMTLENDATKSWWVEGLLQAGPNNMGEFAVFVPYNSARAVKFDIWVTAQDRPRPPEILKSRTFSVLYDTGADIMAIPRESLEEIEELGTNATVLGYTIVETPSGVLMSKVVELDITVQVPFLNKFMSCWLKVPACVLETQPGMAGRVTFLSGPFPRFAFYTGTCPNGLGLLHFTNHKRELDVSMVEMPEGYSFDLPGPPPIMLPPSPGGGPPAHMVKAIRQAVRGKAVRGRAFRGRGRGARGGRGRVSR